MSAFITLGNAARLLAARGESFEDIALWHSLLESQADELKAVKCWTSGGGLNLPGGVSYWRRPDQWQIPRGVFLAWCDRHGYQLQREDEKGRSADGRETGGADVGRRDKQIARILDAIRRQGWNAMNIPTGGKGKIKSLCMTDAGLFTDNGFARAWQAAINAGLLRTANHDTYARR